MMNARFCFALLIISRFWACGGDSVTTPEPPALERGLHEVGNLTRPRYWHAATLLNDGKVLIAGGLEELPLVLAGPPPPGTPIPQPKRLISAEIFDPETGVSTPTGDLTASRSEDHGVLLPDGRVLIIPKNPNLPIERYDAHSGRFNPVAMLPGRIGILTATPLPSGKVFLTSTVYAGVFDPTTGPFSPLFRMDPTRIGHTATLLKDGRVLIAGGQNVGRDAVLLGRNLIYDPSTEALSEAGNLQFDRVNHKAVLLEDGRILIIGGAAGRGPFVQTAEIYDPQTNAFSPAGVSTIDPSAALLLPSGEVFLIRSYNGDIVLYDPATHTFSNTRFSISPRRSFATATLLEDGRVMVAGGLKWTDDNHDWESTTDQIFIFTP